MHSDCREFKTVSESRVVCSILKSCRVVMRVGRGINSFSHLQTSRERHGAQLPQLFESMPRRIKEVMEAQEGHTKY